MTLNALTVDQVQLRLRAMCNLIHSRGYGTAHAFFYIAGNYIKIGVRWGLDAYGGGSRELYFDDIDKAEEFVTELLDPIEHARAEAQKALEAAQARIAELDAG